ncbi:hypothetical protein [Streptomyces sp. NPDC059161]|uniref:hypothetical protein n=1 Tax=unclassified Streptomyces TaxID=2593676 RepID=UPI00365C3DF8
MTPLPAVRTRAARWFTAPMIALALLGTGAGTSVAAPADDSDLPQYVQGENAPVFADPSAGQGQDDLPPYDAQHAQQAVDDMVMGENADAEGQHYPPGGDGQKDGSAWLGPHRDAAYPPEGGDGADQPSPHPPGDPQIVG